MTGKAPLSLMESAAIHQDIAAVSRISAVPSILKVVSELTGMRFTLVARVTPENWTACAVHDRMEFGLEVGGQLDVATTLCKEVCDSKKPIIIEHASIDPIYSQHHTPKFYNIESYLAIPIFRPNGHVFGTLCAIDSNPAKLEPKVIASLTLFSELISRQLRAEEERQEVEQSLWDERKISQLREQFIAVLGHDLRTPLGAITASTDALIEDAPKSEQLELLQGVKESSQQMSHMIEDVLDFARGRLGGGISIDQGAIRDVYELAHQTLKELSTIHRDRVIDFQKAKPIFALVDEVRFRQLLSNIVGNALQHSPADQPVIVKLDEAAGIVRLAVKNAGKPLPKELQGNSFAPFVRRTNGEKSSGLGLGLYIASEIARAHGGSLQASSTEEGTTFTLLIPCGITGVANVEI